MKRLLSPLVLAVGALLTVTGFWWVWTGIDIVQVERGWSSVIAGATMLSVGLLICAIAAVLYRLDEFAAALKTPSFPVTSGEGTVPVPATTGLSEEKDPRAIVGRHTSGNTTYVMFADGTVEAQTPDGVMHFDSLDALRSYADEREAAQER